MSETIAARVERELAEAIISGRLGAGEKLRQDQIAAEWDASHVPVREAFRRLEARGLVTREPRRGVRVAGFTRAEIREVSEMRASLEVLALHHAGPNIDRKTLDLAETITRSSEKSGDMRSWEEANRRFHMVLLEPCGMPRLLSAIEDLQLSSARYFFAGWRGEWEAPSDRDHLSILGALRRRDVPQACALLNRHIRWTPGSALHLTP